MSVTKSKKYPGVYRVDGKKGVSYGIDYIHPQSGARVRKILKDATSEQSAFDARSIEIADAKRGAFNKAYSIHDGRRPVLFEDAADTYLENWSKENKDKRTDKGRIGILKEFFKGKLLSDITPFMVEKFKIAKGKEVSKNTVNKYLSLGSQIYQKAKLWGKFNGINPFLEVSRYRIARPKKPGCLTPEQVGAIMAEMKHPVKRDMIEFAYNTGWRISEITGLKWSDVDLERGTAWVIDPKNRNTVEIELSDRAMEIIRGQDRRGEHVFCMLNGNPFKTGLHGGFIEAAKRAGVDLPPRRAWHILRRTWASMFLQNGGDVETLRVLGNWRDYSMPMWYAEAAGADHKRKILNQIPRPDGRKMAEMDEPAQVSS
ncbi:tyrosine-type recombinase/integrase [Desulfatitalea tepidiphila]|uniref:tyrosine-type recombinase/integrase n=1 Tax=Desulfatitalea tepidiphila TaxID=1185843 RepID=UPI0006B4CD67|nr:tyrosine-type recombinase/integrase [Desulfatitalea tepidiphila]